MIRDFLDRLGAAVETDGMTAVEEDVAVVVSAARAHRLDGVALDVLADTAAPEVARCRALARLAPALIASSGSSAAAGARPALAPRPAPAVALAAPSALDAAGC